MKILDPWDYKLDFILNIGENKIRGPSLTNNDNIRYDLNFIYIENSSEKYKSLITINRTNNYNNLELKIYDDHVLIKNISKSSFYRGSEYLLLGLQIIYRLNYKKSKLEDLSFFICDRKINFFLSNPNDSLTIKKEEEISRKMIDLFRFGSTFYMPFEFKPMILKNDYINLQLNLENESNQNNEISNINKNYKDLSKIVNNLLLKLYKISWQDIDNYINDIKNIMDKNKYKNNDKLFNKWKRYWLNIYKSWRIFYDTYNTKSPGPFQAFNLFDYNQCDKFITWLELYSFSIIFNNEINKDIKELAGIDDFKKIKTIFDKCEWINNSIKSQLLTTKYL